MNTSDSPRDRALRAHLADRNRVFLLVSNIYPAVLGTMIWALISDVPPDFVSWLAILLIVAHFSLDLLYVKLNLEYYGAEDDFRYTWSLFFTDVLIVALIRLAFGTVPALWSQHHWIANPIASFAGIYLLYLLWERIYASLNSDHKPSPASSEAHYRYLAAWFCVCAAAYGVCTSADLSSAYRAVVVAAFLGGVAAACLELYWSVFMAIADKRPGETKSPDQGAAPAASGAYDEHSEEPCRVS